MKTLLIILFVFGIQHILYGQSKKTLIIKAAPVKNDTITPSRIRKSPVLIKKRRIIRLTPIYLKNFFS